MDLSLDNACKEFALSEIPSVANMEAREAKPIFCRNVPNHDEYMMICIAATPKEVCELGCNSVGIDRTIKWIQTEICAPQFSYSPSTLLLNKYGMYIVYFTAIQLQMKQCQWKKISASVNTFKASTDEFGTQ